MKAYLISDNMDTLVGMRLAGVKGIVVHDRKEILDCLNKCIKDKSTGIILITEKAASLVSQEVAELKLSIDLPLIVEIPDRHGTTRDKESITRYVRESIGLKI